MKLHLIDGNNVLRRNFESKGPQWAVEAFVRACQDKGPYGTIIWLWDGAHAKKYRQDIWAGYKAKSDSTDEFYLFMDKFRELLGHSKCLQIRAEGYEADDIIAELVNSKSPDTEIFIDSNDQDYRQLLGDKVQMDYVSESTQHLKSDDIRLHKTLVGDKSDQIKGLSRFGDKGFNKLSDTQKCLLEDFITGETELDEVQAKEQLGFTDATAKKLIESRDELQKYWKIIGFRSVPSTVISSATSQGQLNTQAAQEILNDLALPLEM